MKANISKKIHRLFVLISIVMLSFAYGFLSHQLQIFPYQIIEEAKIAYKALIELSSDQPKKKGQTGIGIRVDRLGVSGASPVSFRDKSGLTKPKSTVLSQDSGGENILYLGNEYAHRDLCPEAGCLAWIADREGTILHAWKNTSDLWASLDDRAAISGTWRVYPTCAYLYPNGDILVSYQGNNIFPYPMGLAKFDKDSKLLWKRNGYYHHWFSVDDEGRIYVPGATIVDSPLYVKGYTYIKCKKKQFLFETVVILDSGGNKIKEIDLHKALIESDLTGVLINYEKNFFVVETCDPMHLNDVRILSEKMAHKFPRFEPGDLLLSFRSINSIGVLDPDTSLFKWFYTGAVQYQHSPRFYGDNQILVFDNLGGSSKDNPSRVAAIDVSSGHAQTVFPRKNIKIPPRYFFSATGGHIDVHSDQKRMLVSWTHQGLVWEIDIESGEVLWEYINTHPVENTFGRIPVYTAIYVNKLDFPLNRGKVP